MLEDTDGDGVFDKSTIYAENLAWPTAVITAMMGAFRGFDSGYSAGFMSRIPMAMARR